MGNGNCERISLHFQVIIEYNFHLAGYLLSLHTLIKQTAMLEKATWQGIEGGLWPTVLEEVNP